MRIRIGWGTLRWSQMSISYRRGRRYLLLSFEFAYALCKLTDRSNLVSVTAHAVLYGSGCLIGHTSVAGHVICGSQSEFISIKSAETQT